MFNFTVFPEVLEANRPSFRETEQLPLISKRYISGKFGRVAAYFVANCRVACNDRELCSSPTNSDVSIINIIFRSLCLDTNNYERVLFTVFGNGKSVIFLHSLHNDSS